MHGEQLQTLYAVNLTDMAFQIVMTVFMVFVLTCTEFQCNLRFNVRHIHSPYF